jgi:hypothetical protein
LILIGLGFSRRFKTKEFQNVSENFQNFEERQNMILSILKIKNSAQMLLDVETIIFQEF